MPRGQFKLQSARDWGGKLERELARIQRAGGDADALSDHCVNFAITAWHMIEWVWSEIKDRVPQNTRYLTDMGEPPGRCEKDDFLRWAVAQCPPLAWCQDITNGAKHVAADRSEGRRTRVLREAIAAEVSASSTTMLAEPRSWVPKIVDADGTRHPALPAFERVEGFWTGFLYQNRVEVDDREDEV